MIFLNLFEYSEYRAQPHVFNMNTKFTILILLYIIYIAKESGVSSR